MLPYSTHPFPQDHLREPGLSECWTWQLLHERLHLIGSQTHSPYGKHCTAKRPKAKAKAKAVVCRFLGVLGIISGAGGGGEACGIQPPTRIPTSHPPTANFVCVCVIVKFCARTICNGWHPYGRQVTFWFTVCYFLYPVVLGDVWHNSLLEIKSLQN